MNDNYVFDELHDGEEYNESVFSIPVITKKESNTKIEYYLFDLIKVWEKSV